MEIFLYDGGVIMKNVWFIALMGISIVFLLLIILMTMIWLFRFFFKSKNSNNLPGKSSLGKPQKEYIKPPQVKRIENHEKRDEEELFAIVSAITTYLTHKEFKIESIKEVPNKELESKREIKTRWMKHEPSISWKPYYKKRWR